MSVRIGAYVLYPDALLLPIAAAFFIVLTLRQLHPRVFDAPWRARVAVAIALACSIAGAWIHGQLGTEGAPGPLPRTGAMSFGSLGGYWGAFAGLAAWAALRGKNALPATDAAVAGLVAGGVIGRVGCLFGGCCRGIHAPILGVAVWQPWPAYDIAALVVAGACALWPRANARAPGVATAQFLITYGVLRGALECVRIAPSIAGVLTLGQALCLIQVAFGAALLALLRRRGGIAGR